MPLGAIGLYLDALPKRQAELRAMLGEAASVPHMEEDARIEWTESIQQYQTPEAAPPQKLGAAGIKLVIERPHEHKPG